MTNSNHFRLMPNGTPLHFGLASLEKIESYWTILGLVANIGCWCWCLVVILPADVQRRWEPWRNSGEAQKRGRRSRISRQFAVSMPAAPSWLAALLAGGRGTTLHRFNPPLVARDLLHRRRSALMANWEKGGTGQCGMGRGSPPSTSATSIVISSHQPLKPPPASPSHYHFQYQF